jgi:DmsE family decaheme c-type cytochrome
MKSKPIWIIPLALAAGLGAWAAEGETCTVCHEGVALTTAGAAHMRLRPAEVAGKAVGCLACHDSGRAAAHAESGDPADIRGYGKDAAAESAACLSCHAGRTLGQWPASEHARAGVGCSACHGIHKDKAQESTCAGCHPDVEASFRLPSRHPVGTGKMRCSSCHDLHAANESALKTVARRNDLCTDCHPSQEGPFVFEHSPAEEDCGLCHAPHGSVANPLLVANEPTLCLQCHEFHFHVAHPGAPAGQQTVGGHVYRNPYGEYGMNRAMTSKCTTCHSRVHGSDLPSQGVPSGGRGLTR